MTHHVVRSAVHISILAAVTGCGAAVPIFPPSHSPPDVRFEGWLLTPTGDYAGRLQNGGDVARNVRIEVWYAAGLTESVRVVAPPTGEIRELGSSYFYASPQMTNGESRYPRLGTISWDGGSRPGQPRKPAMSFERMCYVRPDTLIAYFANNGGWAYHGRATYEDRSGVHTIPISPDPLPARGWDFWCVPRESLGVRLPPRILLVEWEDYGGIRDSLVGPPVDTLDANC